VTEKLREALTYYFVKKLFAVHHEFGIERWGKRRLDMLCMDFRTNLVGVEVKSCLADYRSDKKWRNYLPYVHRMYFCFPQSVMESRVFPSIKEELKSEGVGILTLAPSGKITCALKCKVREVDEERRLKLLIKMAWRGGESRRTVKRVKRVYLEE